MAHDVFISHSAKDKATADAVCAMLESNGIRCWIAPRDVLPSMEWSEAIIDAIEQCRIMVLVFTANANASPQIRREVERAVNHGVPILPLRMEDVLPGKSLEYFIGNVHWLDALTPPFEAHLKSLAGTIKILLARMELGVAPPVQPVASTAVEEAKSRQPATKPAVTPKLPQEEKPPSSSAHRAPETSPAPRRFWSARAWTWAAGTVSALVLAAVFIGVHFALGPGPASSPEPVAPLPQNNPGAAEPGGAAPAPPIPSPDVPAGSASVPKTSPAKKVSPAAPGPSVPAKPAAASPAATSDNTTEITGDDRKKELKALMDRKKALEAQFSPDYPDVQAINRKIAELQAEIAGSPTDQSTLLKETMSTLQNEFSSIGTVRFTAVYQNKTNGTTVQNTILDQFSDVAADPTQCRVSYHLKGWLNGLDRAPVDSEPALPLGDVSSIVVVPWGQGISASTTPPATALVVRLASEPHYLIPFTDAALANRTAETLKQAVKLCGGHLAD
jgi:hypothetical protein